MGIKRILKKMDCLFGIRFWHTLHFKVLIWRFHWGLHAADARLPSPGYISIDYGQFNLKFFSYSITLNKTVIQHNSNCVVLFAIYYLVLILIHHTIFFFFFLKRSFSMMRVGPSVTVSSYSYFRHVRIVLSISNFEWWFL